MLNVIMLSVVMLSVVMLNVMAPQYLDEVMAGSVKSSQFFQEKFDGLQ
jgi:hypothetical protein